MNIATENRQLKCEGLLETPNQPEERARGRHNRAVRSAAASIIAKCVAVSTSLITIPLTLKYLGPERFGLWMTISSLLAVLNFADFGIGNGLVNAVAEADGREDIKALQRYVDSGFVLLASIAGLFLCLLSIFYHAVNWSRALNLHSSTASREVGPAIAVFGFCFASNIFFGIVQKLQVGLQLGYISNIWQLLGSLVGLISVLLVIHFHGGLPWLVLGLSGAPVIAMLLNGLVFFYRTKPELLPSFGGAHLASIRRIASLGFLFFILQIAVALAYASDNLIIARFSGPEAVTQYAVVAKMFSMVSILLSMLMGPLWPAYGEAMSRGDIHWVKTTLKRSVAFAFVMSALGSTILALFCRKILSVWVHGTVSSSPLMIIGLAIWTVFEGTGSALAIFLNGANVLRLQVVLSVIFAGSCLAVKISIVQKIGAQGVPWATLSTYLLCVAIPFSVYIPKWLAKLTLESNNNNSTAQAFESVGIS